MAEIRKHRPRTSAIGDVVRATVDAGPRPVTPGEDPFFVEDEPSAAAGPAPGAASAPVVATTMASEGWFSLGSDVVQALTAASAPSAAEDDDAAGDGQPIDDD